MKAVVAAFSVIENLWMDIFQALNCTFDLSQTDDLPHLGAGRAGQRALVDVPGAGGAAVPRAPALVADARVGCRVCGAARRVHTRTCGDTCIAADSTDSIH